MDFKKCLSAVFVGKCTLQKERDMYVQETLLCATRLFSEGSEEKRTE